MHVAARCSAERNNAQAKKEGETKQRDCAENCAPTGLERHRLLSKLRHLGNSVAAKDSEDY